MSTNPADPKRSEDQWWANLRGVWKSRRCSTRTRGASTMIERIISGGQSGSDQAGWRAAKRFGIATGGTMPLGFLTEDGPRPEFSEMYGAVQMETANYPARTEQNVQDSGFTLIFIDGKVGPGTKLTIKLCRKLGRPYVLVIRNDTTGQTPDDVRYVLSRSDARTINIAGGRESSAPGIGAWVEEYLAEFFRQLGFQKRVP